MSQLREELNAVPPATLGAMALCCFIFCCQILFDLPLQKFTLCPRLILYQYEVHRVITHALFHANFVHIGMNLLSAFAISSAVEKRVGTVYHLMSIMVSIVMISIVYIGISLFLLVIGSKELFAQHAVGFSGVIFHILVLDVSGSSHTRSLFGVVEVPALVYPFALLVVLQLILPNLSFYGHLSGIITGLLQHRGLLNNILITDESRLRDMEGWPIISILARCPAFIPANSEMATFGVHRLPWLQVVKLAVGEIKRLTAHASASCATLVYSRFRQHPHHQVVVSDESSDSDSWNGLPANEDSTQELV